MLKKIDYKLVLILLVALVLRYWGLTHSFPFIFHPDEPTIVRSALGVRFDPNPGHFDWPHLYIYINYFVYMGFAHVRDLLVTLDLKDILSPIFPLMWNDNLVFYFITRILTATLGVLTVIPLYLTGKNIFSKKVGYLSALAIAVTPFHSWHSHYSLSDVPMAFLCSWVIYFSSTVLFRENIKSYLWAGLFIGLSASTKYNGALMVLVLVLAHFLRVFSEPEEKIFSKFQNLIGAGVTSIFGFVVGTPYALLDYKTFVRTDSPKGALWQFTNVGKVNVPQHLQQLSNVFLSKLPDDFGYTLFILFVLGVIFTFYKKKDRVFWFLTIPSLISLYYISGFEKVRSHYFFMAYPTIILLAMSFLSEKVLTAKLHSLFTKLILLCVFLPPLFLSVKGSYIFSREDTRIILNNWLDKRSSSKNLIIDLEDKNIEGNLIFEQNNKLRRGPNIKVYEIN